MQSAILDPKLVAASDACVVLEQGRHYREASFPMLRRQMKPIMRWTLKQGLPLELVFPLCGFVRGLLVRGAYPSRGMVALGLWILDRSHLKNHRNRPGANDEMMSRWFVTGEPWLIEQLFAVAATLPADTVEVNAVMRHHTARWMLHSVRARHVDLNIVLMDLEHKTGAALKPPDPLELAKFAGASMEGFPADDCIGGEWQGGAV